MTVNEGDLLWTPSADRVAGSSLTRFMKWLEAERGLKFENYMELWRWSTSDLEGFWGAVWHYFDVKASRPYDRVLGRREMPGAEWFPGARLNFAENALRNERPGKTALIHLSERSPQQELSWDELGSKVRILATQFRRMGIRPGDRVVAYMPNIPETIIAMFAATSIGAVWASVSPDFGTQGVLDRLAQLEPRVLICVDGYQYGGKHYNRKAEITRIVDGLKTLQHVIFLPYLDSRDRDLPWEQGVFWNDLLDHPPVPASEFTFEQVPFDTPLWILFSSGTTGLPKAIVHGHGGILLEQLKAFPFHMGLSAGDRMFFYSTTGWMMWNFLASALAIDVVPVLYDGNPAYPEPDLLWKMVQDTRTSYFGSSPTFVDIMVKSGIVPRDKFDLSHLRTIVLAGSPVTAECVAWVYRNVKADLWSANGSGGTDFCSGACGGVEIQPVYAGEIQGPCLGVALHAFNEHGESVIDEVGEMVIAQPMPSMPLFFWNDPGNARYRETYFSEFPGRWRHGDFFRINRRGGCFVLGRSDSTLNRFGIRIGTAEIYRALAMLDEVEDSLIVNLDLPGGRFFMPLFVKLRPGCTLDESIEAKIVAKLRKEYTPRHVPDKIFQVPEIPLTLSGKKMEVPIRKILLGVPPEKAANRSTMRAPEALDFFIQYQKTQTDYSLT